MKSNKFRAEKRGKERKVENRFQTQSGKHVGLLSLLLEPLQIISHLSHFKWQEKKCHVREISETQMSMHTEGDQTLKVRQQCHKYG